MTVLERIKETARSKKNISLTVLEQQLGYSNGSLAKAKDIPSSRIKDIADFLEVSMEYLMTGEENRRLIHDSVFSLATIYKVFGYELYLLCDSYLSLAERENKNQLLSFANFLIKREKGKDFEMPTEKEVSNYLSTEKVTLILDHEFNNSFINAAHTRTDIPITEADVKHDEDIMDGENF